MPMIKKPAAHELDWGGFPAPSPEAEAWKPDPNSIPKTGTLPDPRFSKDKWEETKLRKAQQQFGYQLHHSSEVRRTASPSSTSPVSATPSSHLPMGQWPQQAPRQGFQDHKPVATAQNTNISATYAALTVVKTETVGAAVTAKLPSSSKTNKGTMETLSTMPVPGKIPMEKGAFPPWAGALEKALAEDTSRTSSSSSALPSKSVPPHLRGKFSNESPLPQPQIPMVSKGRTVSLDEQFHSAMQASHHVLDSSPADANDKQASINSSTIAETPIGSTSAHYKDYGHYTKIHLVLMMEMDLLKQELLALSDKDLEKRMMSLSSMHQQWFEAHYGDRDTT